MFDPSQFCHIASNARNRQKIAVFLYRNDGLDTPTVPGFFDSKATELNKGDLILVTQPPVAPYVGIDYNIYQVVEKTIDTVKVRQINSNPENQLFALKANKAGDFQTPITSTNKGATMTEINDVIARITGVEQDLTAQLEQAVQNLTSNINTKATKATDFVSPITSTNKGITQVQQSAIESQIDRAATSGKVIGAYWFGKTAAGAVPNPTMAEQNYFDFTTNTPYTAKADLSGWDAQPAITPPANIDAQILITSKFWNIPEQSGQQGGKAFWSHTDGNWAYFPTIVSFESPALTGVPTTPTPTAASPADQIANKGYVDAQLASTVFELLYPVGSIYLTTSDSVNESYLANIIPGSQWQRVADGRALWGSSSGNQTIAAGLPNITAQLSYFYGDFFTTASGAIEIVANAAHNTIERGNVNNNSNNAFIFNASKFNAIYGNSNTVQPPAYTVKVYRRIA